MTLNLTPEQEQRIQALIQTGAYNTVEDVVEAALIAFEQTTSPDFEGAEAELEKLLLDGLDSPELSDEEFWRSVDQLTDASAQPAPRAGIVRDSGDAG